MGLDCPTVKPTVKPKMPVAPSDGKSELPYGSYSRIARRVRPQVSANHVREVWRGARKSARIEAAIARFREELRKEARNDAA